jgi:hypothetical protein
MEPCYSTLSPPVVIKMVYDDEVYSVFFYQWPHAVAYVSPVFFLHCTFKYAKDSHIRTKEY